MDDLATARYVSLTTFTRAGMPKASPVWITEAAGALRFYTGAGTWKIKRLRNDARVELRVCDMRGRVRPHTTVFHGTARVLDDSVVDEVMAAVVRKYGWQARLVLMLDWIKDRIGRGEIPIAVQIDIDRTLQSNDPRDI